MTVSTETWIQAQQSVLGSCLIDEKAVSGIVFGLSEEDFCQEYRRLYRAIRDLYTSGKAVDPVTVLAEAGGEYRQTIRELMEITPTAANVKHYIAITREQSRVLQLREAGKRLAEVNSEAEGQRIWSDAARPEAQEDSDICWSLSRLLKDFFKRYQEKEDYLPWFMEQLRLLLRIGKSSYVVVAGRPSGGKSLFANQSGLYWAVACGKRVGIFSHENPHAPIADRLVACAAGVPLDRLQDRKLSDAELNAVCAVSARINEAPLYIWESAGMTVEQIEEIALRHRLDIVILDYLQIIAAPGDTEYTQVSYVSKAIQRMCRKHKIMCMALCQLSRTKGAKPTLEDLRGSGQIEQDADVIVALHKLEEPGSPREFLVLKNREGECRPTKFYFDGARQRLLYLGKGDQPLKAFDYSKFTCRPDGQELEPLGMNVETPFD